MATASQSTTPLSVDKLKVCISHTHMHICVHVCTCTHTYTHVQTHTHTHIIFIETDDYGAVSGSVEISESEMSKCVSVSIVSDSVEEGEECFLVSFSSSSSDFTLQTPSIATVCITDG